MASSQAAGELLPEIPEALGRWPEARAPFVEPVLMPCRLTSVPKRRPICASWPMQLAPHLRSRPEEPIFNRTPPPRRPMKPAQRLKLAPKLAAIAAAAAAACSANAFEIDTGNPDLKLRWDNTVKYSNAFRLKDQMRPCSPATPAPRNLNDGNNNFGKGLVSNRFDLFSELDLQMRNFGARVSGVSLVRPGLQPRQRQPQQHVQPHARQRVPRRDARGDGCATRNCSMPSSGAASTSADKPVTVRLGRHTLLWGETLFFGGNGIAGGQAPLDLVKLLSVPNSQFKEVARPIGKLSGQMQLTDELSLGAYVGYEWDKTRLMPVGAYLSASDTLGPGAERINAGPTGRHLHQGARPRCPRQRAVGLAAALECRRHRDRLRLLRDPLSRHRPQQQLHHAQRLPAWPERPGQPALPAATAGPTTRASAPTASAQRRRWAPGAWPARRRSARTRRWPARCQS